MRIPTGAVAALLLLTLSFSGPAVAAGIGWCADLAAVGADASVRSDGGADAGAFIKPEAASQSLAERSQASPSLMTGSIAPDRRGSGPFSPLPFLGKEPAPPSASTRLAHLQVYRL